MSLKMNEKFYLCDRNTTMLMPQNIQDWLPENHIARFVVDVIEDLDVSELEKKYSTRGAKAYPIKMMLSLIFYAYINGIFSSRKIEAATYDSVAFRFVAGNFHPDHDTIASFRQNFSSMFDRIFKQILLIAAEAGFLQLGDVSVDGTKIKACASKHKALSWKYAKQLEEQIEKEIVQLKEKAKAADNQANSKELNIPSELKRREDRLAEIQRAKNEIEKRAKERYDSELEMYKETVEIREAKEAAGKKCRGVPPKKPSSEPKDKDQVNLIDKESRIMPKSGSKDFEQAYNAQIAVEQKNMFIISNHVTQNTNDKKEIEPALDGIKNTENLLQQKCHNLSGDAGYFSKKNVELCEKANIDPLIVDKRDKHNSWLEQQEKLELEDGVIAEDDPVIKMKKRLKTLEGKKIYSKRKSTVEPVFGIIKNCMNFRGVLRRGLKAAKEEWNTVSIAWNLKRLHALIFKNKVYTTC